MEKLAAFVVFATPTPNILAVAVVPAAIQNGSADSPHDNAECKEKDGKYGVVDSGLLSALVTSTPVGVEDADGKDERDAGDDQ